MEPAVATSRAPARAQRVRARQLAAALVAVLAAVTPAHAVAAPDAPTQAAGEPSATAARRDMLAELRSATGATFASRTDPQTAIATFLGSSPAAPLAAATPGDPAAVALGFARRWAGLLGAADKGGELQVGSTHAMPDGGHAVRLAQSVDGVAVLAAGLVVRLGADGSVIAVAGELSQVAEVPPGREATAGGGANEPVVLYDPDLVGATGTARLARLLDIGDGDGDGDEATRQVVDASTGAVLLTVEAAPGIRQRLVCDDGDLASNPEACDPAGPNVAREEGDAATGVADVDRAFDLAGVTYDFYDQVLGRDSLDGAGMPLVSTVRWCEAVDDCPAAGAWWNGEQMVYGSGWTVADDIVGHEFTHGFTERTSGLLMYGESGAIAESVSDVLGELIDQWSTVSGPDPSLDLWEVGEQAPGGALRNMRDPGAFDDPDRMTSARYAGTSDDAHGIHTNSGVGNKAAYLIAAGSAAEPGGAFNGQSISGLGLTKTARLYAELSTALLGAGSDYADLYDLLPQACADLIGAGGMTTGDCQQVRKAVIATEMDRVPLAAGARLTAPVCDADQVVTATLFGDDMEDPALPGWLLSASTTDAAWTGFEGSSTSGTHSMHAPDLPDPAESSAMIAAQLHVPSGTSTYLRFAHSFSFEADTGSIPHAYLDGGVVEYSIDQGATWLPAGARPGTINGYQDDVVLAEPWGNPLGGRPAFSGASAGYQETRIDLSSLEGEQLDVRFVVGSDGTTGADGWFLDDVQVYSCDEPSAPDAPRAVGADSNNTGALVQWLAPVSNGGMPITRYRITTYLGASTTGSSTTLTDDDHTSFQITGLVNGDTYGFSVAAENSIGIGPESAIYRPVVPAPSAPWQPTDVVAAPGDTQATVSWTAPGSDGGEPITKYVVTAYDGITAVATADAPPTSTTSVVPGLSNGTTYTFKVYAENSRAGPPSFASNPVTPAGPPDPPTNVTLYPEPLAVTVTWTAPAWHNGSPVTGYVITPYLAGTPQARVTTPDAATAFTVTDLQYDQPYTFAVAAMNAAGTGAAATSPSSARPTAKISDAPTAVVAVRGDRRASVSWAPPASTGGAPIMAYVVTPYVGLVALTPTTSPDATPAVDIAGLVNGTTYTFKVAAVTVAGTGPQSSASTPVVPAGLPGPAANVVATPRHRSVDLIWSPPSSVNGAPITGYLITPYRSGAAQTPVATAGPVESVTVAGLVNGQPYAFTVVALNAVGASAPASSATVVPLGAPEAPTAITGSRGDGTVALAWTSPVDTGGRPITAYVITPYVGGSPRTATVTPSSATAFALSGLANGTQYTFRVAAVTNVGTGPESSDFVVLTPAGSPGAPRAVAGVAGKGSVLVSWQPPAYDGGDPVSGYVVTTYRDGVASGTTEAPGTAGSIAVTGLTRDRAYSFTVTARNATGLGTPSAPTAALRPRRAGYTPVGPDRIFDTRPGESPDALRMVDKIRVGGAHVLEVKVTDLPGLVPPSDVGAVSLNVVATNVTAPGFLTVYPCGARKLVASVNHAPGQTVGNAVIAPVSGAGTVCFYSLAPVDVIVDLNGWFAADSDFAAVGPDRVLDTRPGESPGALRSVPKVRVGGSEVLVVQMTDLPGLVPAGGIGAVSLNVAVTNPERAGFVTVYPCGDRKLVANVNYPAGATVANAVITPVSPDGRVCFYSLAAVDIIVDINGWFASGPDFTAVGPDRVLDTRPGESPGAIRDVEETPVGNGRVLRVRMSGMPGLTPASDLGAVSLNVAVTNARGPGFVTVFPCGERRLAASVNHAAGQTVANAVLAPVSADGDVCFFSFAAVDLIVDVNGWFPAPG